MVFKPGFRYIAFRLIFGFLAVTLGSAVLAQTRWSSDPRTQDVRDQDAPKGVFGTRVLPKDCAECGSVTAITVSERPGDANVVGAIAGGVAGAVIGRQMGSGLGKDLATIAGAAGGAYAGNKIQESLSRSKVWTVRVKYTDGHNADVEFTQDPGLNVGDAVRNSGGTLVRN